MWSMLFEGISMNSQYNWEKNKCAQKQALLSLFTMFWLVGLCIYTIGLPVWSWRKALTGWLTKAVPDIQNRDSYEAKAVKTSLNAARTNCDFSPFFFFFLIWSNDLPSSEFLCQLLSLSTFFTPLFLLAIHCSSFYLSVCRAISVMEIRRKTHRW